MAKFSCGIFDENVGIVIPEYKFEMFSKLCKELPLTSIKIDESRILYSFSTEMYSFLNKDISEVLDKLVPFGIIQYLADQHLADFYGKSTKIDVKIAKVLNLDDFRFLAILWIFLYGISVIVFILEYSKPAAKEICVGILRYCYSRF